MDRSTKRFLPGPVFYILLGLSDRERYGLGIVQDVERHTGGDVRLGPGTLYNAIKKMLHAGLIEETVGRGDPRDDDPRRRYYQITQAGRDTVEADAARLERLVLAAHLKKILPARRSS